MIDAVRNAMSMMGASLDDALVMASRTPARFLDDSSRGIIAEGAVADLVVIDRRDLSVAMTLVAGC
jgi:N-acetylglucosamine-6-phosphate deacetylase